MIHLHANTESKLHNLTDPNSTILIGECHASRLAIMELLWLVSINANEDMAAHFRLDGANLIHGGSTRVESGGGSTVQIWHLNESTAFP